MIFASDYLQDLLLTIPLMLRSRSSHRGPSFTRVFWQSCKLWAQEQRPGFRVAGEPRLESVPASAEQPETTKLRMHLPLQLQGARRAETCTMP